MRNIIESLDPSDRLKYDYDLLEQKYVENQSRLVDDAESFDELKNTLAGRKIVLVAPGKSSSDNVMMINSYINDNNAISIAVNAILPGYDYDYLFFSNAVRYDYARETFRAAFDRNKRIILLKIFWKGSRIMFLFVVENTYESIQTMQINVQGLNVVCKYSGYEEK